MRKILFSCLLLIFILLPKEVMAQSAGTIITGRVSDNYGPVVSVNILEQDASKRTVGYATTDINGNFSLRIINPKDILSIKYVGYKPQELPIKGTAYNIKLIENTQLSVVEVVSNRVQAGGLSIPEREISSATQRISAKEFEGLGITSIDEGLQGRIAGLDIVGNSGNLGAGTTIRLRGVSSINGNSEPLVVVDGNIFETDAYNNFDYANANDEKFAQLLNVNPADIESIKVSKDAAATAIWGSQGANGVIEIKTKRGSRGRTVVTYSLTQKSTRQPNGISMMNGDEYTMFMKEAYFNAKLSNSASDIIELNYDKTYKEYQMYNNNTDWIKAVKQTGQEYQNYVSISGGGEKAYFRISGGYDNIKGTVIAQTLNRYTVKVALDYFVSERIKFLTNFSLTNTDNQRNTNYNPSFDVNLDLLAVAYRKMPNLSIYDEDINGKSTGEYYNMLSTSSSALADQRKYGNPIASAYLNKNEERSNNVVPEFQLVYNLLGTENSQTQLQYTGAVNFNIFNKYENRLSPLSLITTGWSDKAANSSSENSDKSLGIVTTHTMVFTPFFSNLDHTFTSSLRAQTTSGSSTAQKTALYGLPSGTITSTAADAIIDNFETGAGQWRSAYFTFQAHYAFKGKYMLDVSVRRDGSTKFGPNRRWGTFPGLSLRWNASDEPFMQKFKWLSMLSIRPGWGKVGNPPGDEALYFSKYSGDDSYLGQTSTYPNNIRLSNLKWESKETYNLGFDLGLFDDKITSDINLYAQYTSDLLMKDRAISTSSGFTNFTWQNTGSILNKGWELNINANRFIKKGKFSMDFNLVFSNNSNELTEMNSSILSSINNLFDRKNGSYLTRVQLHSSYGSMYGFRYKGVYQYSDYSDTEVKGVSGPNSPVVRNNKGNVILNENGKTKPVYFCYGTSSEYEFKGGDAVYEDINHDGNINELDIVYLGSSLPKITGGFGFKLNYGRWTLNNQFNFRAGNKIINAARMNAESMYNNNNQSKAVNWRWRTEGDLTSIPRALYQAGNNYLGSDRFIEDGSFLRLNFSQLSYSIDPKIAKTFGMSEIRLNFSLDNLFCLTHYSGADPEVGYGGWGITTDNAQTPRKKSSTIRINLIF